MIEDRCGTGERSLTLWERGVGPDETAEARNKTCQCDVCQKQIEPANSVIFRFEQCEIILAYNSLSID